MLPPNVRFERHKWCFRAPQTNHGITAGLRRGILISGLSRGLGNRLQGTYSKCNALHKSTGQPAATGPSTRLTRPSDAYRCLSGWDVPYAVHPNLEESAPCSSLITITPTPPVAETEVAGPGSQDATHPNKHWVVMDHTRRRGKGAKEAVPNKTS